LEAAQSSGQYLYRRAHTIITFEIQGDCAMRTTDFLMSALVFSMLMNVLCLGIVLAAVMALRNDIRREAADRLKVLPAWARQMMKA
jgi:hypothetical protein